MVLPPHPKIRKQAILPLILTLALLLAACTAETPPGRDEAQIYAAAIRQQYGPDDTFGGTLQAPILYLVRQTDDSIGDPDIAQSASVTLAPELQEEISALLADLPAEVIWVDSRDEVELNPDTGKVAGNGVVIQVGNIHEGEGNALLLSTSIYIASLAAGGQTYILEQIDGEWTVTGDTGVRWIS